MRELIPCSEPNPGENLLLQESVLELLLSQDLATFLTPSDKIGHDLLCGTEWQVFEYLKAFS